MKRFTLASAQNSYGQQREWLYNALDNIATRQIADVLLDRMDETATRYYNFEMASQSPAFSMTRRGIKVDIDKRDDRVDALKKELKVALANVDKMPVVQELWDGQEKVTGNCPKSIRKDGRHSWERGVEDTPARTCTACGRSRFKRSRFNPNSPEQVKHLFYDILGVKHQFNKKHEIAVDKDALEKIERKYPAHSELVGAILAAKGLKKQIGFLNTKLGPNNRYTSEFVVGTAWTGRWASNDDPFHHGGNSQNIAERNRDIFIADPGCELVYADLKQAESNLVAHMAGDEEYIEAHKSGDVHTYVTRLVWPDMDWTWDIFKDKKVASALPTWDNVPGHSFRFQSKRVQHGSNYGLTPFGIAIIAHIPVIEAKNAQRSYFRAFPGIREWQRQIAELVRAQKPLYTPLGFRIKLFGRPWDEHTVKQGYSVLPQGTVAHIIAIGAWRIWREMDPGNAPLQRGQIMVLAQIHDALLLQRVTGDDEALKRALELMRVPLPVVGADGKTRVALIETEAAVGKNWGHQSAKNPDGVHEVEFEFDD